MPGQHRRPRRKTRTREHVIEDLSVNHLERFVLRTGHTMERFRHDYGLDLTLFTYSAQGESEPGCVLFQVEATDALKWRSGGKQVAFRVGRADLERWLIETMPVILVVYDAPADVAYWLYVQEYFHRIGSRARRQMGDTVTVYIPRESVLDVEAVHRFRDFKRAVLAQLHGVTHGEA